MDCSDHVLFTFLPTPTTGTETVDCLRVTYISIVIYRLVTSLLEQGFDRFDGFVVSHHGADGVRIFSPSPILFVCDIQRRKPDKNDPIDRHHTLEI